MWQKSPDPNFSSEIASESTDDDEIINNLSESIRSAERKMTTHRQKRSSFASTHHSEGRNSGTSVMSTASSSESTNKKWFKTKKSRRILSKVSFRDSASKSSLEGKGGTPLGGQTNIFDSNSYNSATDISTFLNPSDLFQPLSKTDSTGGVGPQGPNAATTAAAAAGQYEFQKGDYVLVSLSVLNQSYFGSPFQNTMSTHPQHTTDGTLVGSDSLKDTHNYFEELKQKVTCSPVNRFGYPAGYGITVGEQRGPYLYVLAEVTSKCYGEDAKYYVVKRCDTGLEQRADAKWMWKDPIKKDDKVMAIALRAAKQNLKNRHLRENEEDLSKRFIPNKSGPFTRISKWFSRNIGDPWMSLRRTMKHHVTLMIMGLSPYAIQIRITGVNVLVCCSFLFLFIDQIRLVLYGPQYDYGIITLSAVIWVILALELCAEVAIRPEGYSALIQGEKKYKPSTARYINRFHLVCESLALLFFLPELQCLSSAEKSCDEEYPFSLLYAIRGILLQEHIFTSYFIIIVMKLRIFGLVRHWKQMKFNRSIFEIKGKGDIRNVKGNEASRRISEVTKNKSNKKDDDEREDSDLEEDREDGDAVGSSEEEQELNNADKIGTALMVVNSHRAMIIL